jgi:hypothetical protein
MQRQIHQQPAELPAKHEHTRDATCTKLQLTLCSRKASSKAARRSSATVWSPHSGILNVLAMYMHVFFDELSSQQ